MKTYNLPVGKNDPVLICKVWDYIKRLYPEKIGFWVWVLGWALYPNLIQKLKNFYTQTQNLNPKPKNCYTQPNPTRNLNPKPKNIYTLTQNRKPKNFLGTNVWIISPYKVFRDIPI